MSNLRALAALLVAVFALLTATPQPTCAQEEFQGVGMVKLKSAFRFVRPPPNHRPPPFRKPPPAASPSPAFTHEVDYNELQILCPQEVDSSTNYTRDDPQCAVPRGSVAVGDEAEAVRAEFRLLSGDLVNVTLEEVDESEPGSRRRMLSQLREELATGRRLLNTDTAPLPGRSFRLKSLRPVRQTEQKEIYTGTPIDLRTVVFIMDFSDCRMPQAPAVTKERVTRDMLKTSASPANNLAGYYSTCSYGKTIFNPDNFIVVGPVPMKCAGNIPAIPRPPRPAPPPRPPPRTISTKPAPPPLSRRNATYEDWWDLSRFCSASEQQAWERAAEAFAQAEVAKNPGDPEMQKLARLLQWRTRRRNLFILPSNVRCSWAGYADVTCTSATCSAYVRGYGSATTPHVVMHEVMHNYGLEHAGRGFVEYGDQTDVMGDYSKASAGLLCPNAPNMYRIGWAKPLNEPGTPAFASDADGPPAFGNLTVANFTSNWIRGLVIPAQGTRDDNMNVVNVGAAGPELEAERITGVNRYYFSYRVQNRTSGGYDSGITSSFNRKVLVHSYNGIQSERVFGFKPNLIDWGPNFQSKTSTWTSPFVALRGGLGGAVRVVVVSTSDTQAVVNICRMTETRETTCNDGFDNDCDGAADDEDGDCQ
uniref:Matrix metalloprotease n=1 Tax=Chlamydomonas reinhardtii TaxID=3055 RepID=Q76DI1_CHLRE|nr:matrix metalloprotease [Chlamydomonas reinhardtii]